MPPLQPPLLPAKLSASALLMLRTCHWMLWFAPTTGLLLLRSFLQTEGATSDLPPAALSVGLSYLPTLVAWAIRFAIIPKLRSLARVFPVFLLGIVLTQITGMLGLFYLDGSYGNYALITCIVTLFLYIPIFIHSRKYSR